MVKTVDELRQEFQTGGLACPLCYTTHDDQMELNDLRHHGWPSIGSLIEDKNVQTGNLHRCAAPLRKVVYAKTLEEAQELAAESLRILYGAKE